MLQMNGLFFRRFHRFSQIDLAGMLVADRLRNGPVRCLKLTDLELKTLLLGASVREFLNSRDDAETQRRGCVLLGE
jgi:hypothetical protein